MEQDQKQDQTVKKKSPDFRYLGFFVPENVVPKVRAELTQGLPYRFLSLMKNYAGEGASAGRRPSCRSSSHNAAGIEYDIIWKFSSASETVRGPGIAAVTAG